MFCSSISTKVSTSQWEGRVSGVKITPTSFVSCALWRSSRSAAGSFRTASCEMSLGASSRFCISTRAMAWLS